MTDTSSRNNFYWNGRRWVKRLLPRPKWLYITAWVKIILGLGNIILLGYLIYITIKLNG